jgi:hypothetical protein
MGLGDAGLLQGCAYRRRQLRVRQAGAKAEEKGQAAAVHAGIL